MSILISPNMSLPVPVVGTEQGPDYALDVNSCLTLIDGHDHSPGSGVQVTPAGLNINTTLTFNSQQATNVLSVSFTAQGTASAVLQSLSVAPGTESPDPIQDLWYTDGAGTAIQITAGGLVNSTVGSLPGESYSAGTFFWKQGTGSTIPANFDIGSIVLRPNVAATSFGTTLQPPSAIASAYTLTLPPDPSTASGSKFLILSTAGVITGGALVDNSSIQFTSDVLSVKAGGITAAMIASGVLPNLQHQDFTSSGSFVVPTGVSILLIEMISGGGGGGGGGRGGGAGGQGGSGSNPVKGSFVVTPGSTLTVTVGTGGAGGAAQATPSANGNNGGSGTSSAVSFAGTNLLTALGQPGGFGSNNGGPNVSGWGIVSDQIAGGGGGSDGPTSAYNVGGQATATGGAGGGGGPGALSNAVFASPGGPSGLGVGASLGGHGHGAGGGGGQLGNNTSSNSGGFGGAGADGLVRIIWVAP